MKKVKIETVRNLLQQDQAIDLSQLTPDEMQWLDQASLEIKGNIIRVVCVGPDESAKAKLIMDKITGAKIRIVRTIIETRSERTRENLKKLVE